MPLTNPLTVLLADLPAPLPRIEDYVALWGRLRPRDLACIEQGHKLTFAELGQHVERAARRLAADGVGEGDCVAVLAPPSADYLVSFLATTARGATWLGLNPKYTAHELQNLIADAKPKLVLARPEIAGRDYRGDFRVIEGMLRTIGARLSWLSPQQGSVISSALIEADRSGAVESIAPRVNPVAALVYTSGTTGAPKAAQLTHSGLIRAALVRSRVWKVEPLRLIHNVPINHVGGLGDLTCMALVAGGAQVFLERFSAEGTLSAIATHKVTYWYQAPTMFEMCLNAPEAAELDWSSLQAAIWSGGRPSDALVCRLASVAPKLGVDYSMTESIGPITLSPLWDGDCPYDGHVGWPDPQRGLRIVAANGEPCERSGEIGEVEINDAWMFAGYRGRANSSADGWFKTGDLATREACGAWRLVGRSKEMFKSGGYNVYPREVELVIEAFPGVRSVALVETPDALFGEVGVAFVACDASVDVGKIADFCRTRLANYKVPKRIEIVRDLPMLPIGKVDKARLRSMASAESDS
ncbi:MAG: class I adenylate-forming enzyme family protein [Hyphomonadaceae bacterium]|nr:class I adenylate-forming enzyme family protein [Hyphomonadaceae bacterium]